MIKLDLIIYINIVEHVLLFFTKENINFHHICGENNLHNFVDYNDEYMIEITTHVPQNIQYARIEQVIGRSIRSTSHNKYLLKFS